VWPTAIGVIAIVFGALGCIQALFGMILPMMIPLMDRAAAQAAQMPHGSAPVVNPFATMRKFVWWLVLGYGLLGVTAAALGVCGIGLVQRGWWAGKAIRIWGVWGIFLAIGLGVMVGFIYSAMIGDMFQSIAASTPTGSRPGAAPPQEMAWMMGIVGGVVVSVMLMIFPMFITIWFLMPGVRKEVARWRVESGRAGALAP
jgi:hypothetical protein